MPPREKRANREKTAIRRLFEEKRHIGGRLPTITEVSEEASQPEYLQEASAWAPPRSDPSAKIIQVSATCASAPPSWRSRFPR